MRLLGYELKIEKIPTELMDIAFEEEYELMLNSTPESISHCSPLIDNKLNQLLLRAATERRHKYLVDGAERYVQIKANKLLTN